MAGGAGCCRLEEWLREEMDGSRFVKIWVDRSHLGKADVPGGQE